MELGIPELLIILVIIVLLWGPGRLAKIGGELGNGIRSFREGLSSDVKDKAAEAEAETVKEEEPEKEVIKQ